MKEKIEQPSVKEQEVLNDVINDNSVEVQVVGTKKKYKVSWLKRGTIRKISNIMLSKGADEKVSCKVAASIILNDFWKIKFFHWMLWRWLFYVKQYGDEQLIPIVETGKKKIPVESYYYVTMLATGMRDTMMTMTRMEIERILQEQASVQREA